CFALRENLNGRILEQFLDRLVIERLARVLFPEDALVVAPKGVQELTISLLGQVQFRRDRPFVVRVEPALRQIPGAHDGNSFVVALSDIDLGVKCPRSRIVKYVRGVEMLGDHLQPLDGAASLINSDDCFRISPGLAEGSNVLPYPGK